MALFFYLRLWPGLLAGLGLLVVAALSGYVLFRLDWVLPVVGMQLGVVLSYLGVLATKLTGEEKERTRLRGMFGQYVSDEVVEKLLASGHRPDLGGETLPVTVLFSDIRNFTTISERLSASEVVEMLNAYLERACEPILRAGGTVDKFIGDSIMAVFGSPVPHPDHARRAVRAALDMIEAARTFERDFMKKQFGGRDLPDFRIGVGLHTGPAVIGNIGSQKRIEFTAIGDTVNIASRLEGLTKTLGWKIVASMETLTAAGSGVAVGGRQGAQVKGRLGEVQVVEILNLEGSEEARV
jgi:adenylate cyclase